MKHTPGGAALDPTLHARLMRDAANLLAPVVIANALLPFLLSAFLRPEAHWWQLGAWCAASLLVSGARYLRLRAYYRDPQRDQRPAKWDRDFAVGYVASGLTWSVLGTVLFPSSASAIHLSIGFVLAAVATVALVATGPLYRTYVLFLIAYLGPMVVFWFTSAAENDATLGLLALLYIPVLLFIARRTSGNARALAWRELESEQLAARLATAMAEADVRRRELETEISDRRLAQSLERSAGARLRMATESVGIVSWEFDPELRTLQITGAPEALTASNDSPSTQALTRFMDRVHPEDRPQLRADLRAAHTVGALLRMQFRMQFPRGWRWISITGRVVENERGHRLLMGVSQDVTRRREAEDELRRAKESAEAASEAKSQFLANMSHEIRTPLNGVVGMLELLSESSLSAQQQRMAESASRSSEALLGVINNILDLSKIEANHLEIEAVAFSFPRLVDDVTSLLADSAAQQQLGLTCQVDPAIPALMLGDPNRIRQVLTNLVANALKFTERGTVGVELTRVDTNTTTPVRVRCAVKDSGIGLSTEECSKLFLPFSQADMSTSRRFGGTGLGLAISQQLVQLMGGEIAVSSEPGVGSEFWFELSLPEVTEVSDVPGEATQLVGQRVLIVEDSPTNRTILHAQCESFGMEVQAVSSGPEALELLHSSDAAGTPFHVVLLDMCLEGMTGLQVARSISRTSNLRRTRMILLASDQEMGDLAEARRAGISATLTKPVKREALREAIGSALHTARTPAQRLGSLTDAPVASSRARVLVVEDHEVNRQVASAMLARLGCIVVMAEGGEEGVQIASREQFDFILMDCQMPVVDGFAATHRIRDGESGERRVPIIALTANALQGDRERCLDAGMDDYLSKPFSRAALREMVERWAPQPAPSREAASPSPESAPVSASVSASEPVPDDRLLDPGMLTDIELIDPSGALLQEVVNTFLESAPTQLQALAAAREAGDLAAMAFASHTLASASGCVGARMLTQQSIEIERLARQSHTPCTEEQLDALAHAFARSREALLARAAHVLMSGANVT